jgi:carboxyl-terminal processing protease
MTLPAVLRPLLLSTVILMSPAGAVEPKPDADQPATNQVVDDAKAAASDEVSVEDIRVFTAVFREVQRSYVEPVSAQQLMKAAIRGLLLDLDPHSAYLRKNDLQALTDGTSGSYGGLGLEVQIRAGQLTVIAPLDESPAARAGIQSGDVISRIDGLAVESDNADIAIDRMRGDAGTKVKITVLRAGQPPIDLELTREVIDVTAVRARLLAPGFGYVRIAAFQDNTGEETAKRIASLIKPGKPLDGLVLDLRSNPGGLLDAAVEVSDLFLNDGSIVSTRGRVAMASAEFTATAGDVLKGAPLVVLVDGGSASASEIVAGALQDRKRALILGQRTFGKGSVQSVLPLESGEAIKLTTALYFTPAGRSIQAEGIIPDVELQPAELKPISRGFANITEAELPGHLGNGNRSAVPAVVVPGDAPLGADTDFVLQEALNVLRALSRWQVPAEKK